VPYAQSVTLQAALQAVGVKNKFTTVPGGGHGGFTDAYNSQSENEITTFLTEVEHLQTTGVNQMLNNDNIKIKQSGNQVNIVSEEKTLTKVYDAIGKELFQTRSQTFQITQKGLFIIKTYNTLCESVFKVLVN